MEGKNSQNWLSENEWSNRNKMKTVFFVKEEGRDGELGEWRNRKSGGKVKRGKGMEFGEW